jgi:signal transduction histidine kinase
VAAEIEAALLLHHTEGRLYELTGERTHANLLAEATSRVRRWLGAAHQHVDSSAEQVIMERLSRDIQDYLAAARETTPGDAAIAAPLTKALATVEELLEISVRDATRSVRESARLHRAAIGIAVAAAIFIALALTLVIMGIRHWVYRPLASVRAGIRRFREGDAAARIPEDGPAELRDIAAQFNEMAGALARERENRLGFLAGVAHDLRNPLNALRITTHRLRADGPPVPVEQASHMLDLVARQVARLDRMVEDLLDTARIEAGKLDLQLEAHDTREVVKESVELYRLISRDHELRLMVPEAPVSVLCDPYRMAQVVNNLLSNAIKYSPHGGTVDVRVDRDRDAVLISVSDEGVGIHPDDMRRIFDPFQRGSTTDVPGVGLGLSVARRIAQAHGGAIRVESRQGAGTTFELRLPALAG